MPETTFTFRLDEDLKNAFAQAAKAQERTSAQLLRTLMRDLVEQAIAKREYDEWFVKEVDEAIKEADDPNTVWVPHEEVLRDIERQRTRLMARIKDAAE